MTDTTVRGIRPILICLMGLGLSACSQPAIPPERAMLPNSPSATLALAKEPATTQPVEGKSDFALTIYSSADPQTFAPQALLTSLDQNGYAPYTVLPGFGVVREVRTMNLTAGLNRREFAGVAAGIDPTTVAFKSLTAPDTTSALEQNLEFDQASPDKMIAKSLGREIIISAQRGSGSQIAPLLIRGVLLSATPAAYLVQTEDVHTPIVLVQTSTVQSVRFADAKTGFVTQPTLNWKINTQTPGDHQVQVTYQTDGLTWRADYDVLLSEDETTADMSAWVTALNLSGMAYPEARLKLIAGNVRRFSPENQAGGAMFAGAGGAAAEKTFVEKPFFEYHLYTLDHPTTLPNNASKQIELFPAKAGVNVGKIYVYYGAVLDDTGFYGITPKSDREFGLDSNPNVDIYLRFQNSLANHLGIPLPAGRMRLYKADTADGNRQFIGEDVIHHTPQDEFVMARIGTTFDLVGERTQTEFKEGVRSCLETFSIKLRNHKDAAARVIVKETLYRWDNWEITESSDKFEKQDFRTIHIPVEVPANGEKTLTYSVKYSW